MLIGRAQHTANMKRIVLAVLVASVIAACQPVPTVRQVLANKNTSRVMTWQCPSNGDRPLYMNDAGYSMLPQAGRAKCHRIHPTHL